LWIAGIIKNRQTAHSFEEDGMVTRLFVDDYEDAIQKVGCSVAVKRKKVGDAERNESIYPRVSPVLQGAARTTPNRRVVWEKWGSIEDRALGAGVTHTIIE
jgi:hypothetical protein